MSKSGHNNFLEIFDSTKNEKSINIDLNDIKYDDIANLENLDKFQKFKKNIEFSLFKTKYMDNEGIGIIYKFDYGDDKSTATFFVQTVMEIIKFLENTLTTLDKTELIRELEDSSKEIALLICFKKI